MKKRMKNNVNFKALTGKEKAEYIWDYYKWHIIVTVAVLIGGVSLIYDIATYRAPLVNVVMIDAIQLPGQNGEMRDMQEFMDRFGYDSTKNDISLNKSIQLNMDEETKMISLNKLMCFMAAREVDVYFWTGDTFDGYMQENTLTDLSLLLPGELLEANRDRIVTAEDIETGKEYPCGLDLTGNAWSEANGYPKGCFVGIAATSDNLEPARDFLEYILTAA